MASEVANRINLLMWGSEARAMYVLHQRARNPALYEKLELSRARWWVRSLPVSDPRYLEAQKIINRAMRRHLDAIALQPPLVRELESPERQWSEEAGRALRRERLGLQQGERLRLDERGYLLWDPTEALMSPWGRPMPPGETRPKLRSWMDLGGACAVIEPGI